MKNHTVGFWFDEYGYCKHEKLLMESGAIADSTERGRPADAAVRYWRERLGFVVPRQRAIIWLVGTGGWDPEELNELTDSELAEIVLWMACGDLQERGEWFGLVE